MSFDTLAFGMRLRKVREERGLTQDQLAERLHISYKHLAKIETGLRSATAHFIYEVAKELNVTTDYLYGLNPNTATSESIRSRL